KASWITDSINYCLEEENPLRHQFWRITGKSTTFLTKPCVRAMSTLFKEAANRIQSTELVFHLLCVLEIMFRDLSVDRIALIYATHLVFQYKHQTVVADANNPDTPSFVFAKEPTVIADEIGKIDGAFTCENIIDHARSLWGEETATT